MSGGFWCVCVCVLKRGKQRCFGSCLCGYRLQPLQHARCDGGLVLFRFLFFFLVEWRGVEWSGVLQH